ncbi:hypothetical protein AVEN_121544-1 [Araneus ventricosus]|uniref:Retroviral polymerase SH3-like domain-containing protein n=1 Tax=Araneus ventricosus TaxID=182803 RepID=A0A4Y2GNB2_ARAVE|nr:hypothetical protein AVEN_121544-1 [Araneus ventricosus]
MLYDSKLPKSCWGYAIQAAAFLHNRIPCTSINDCTPYELKYSIKTDLSKIGIFGCDAYVKVADTQRIKLDPKSKQMIFIGYSSIGYRVMDPVTRRVTVSRKVRFDEKKIISDKLAATPNIQNQEDTSDLGEEIEKRNGYQTRRN